MREETRRRVCGCKITVDLDDPSYRAVLESMCPACVEKLGRIEAQAAARERLGLTPRSVIEEALHPSRSGSRFD